jgi:hypothetical protein
MTVDGTMTQAREAGVSDGVGALFDMEVFIRVWGLILGFLV